jgi:chromosome segregation ATPase
LTLLAAAATIAQAGGEAAGLPPWAYMALTLVLGGGGVAWYMARVEKRLKSGQAEKAEAEADSVSVGAATDAVQLVRQELRVHKKQMSELRDELLAVKEQHAKALTQLAEAQLAYAELESKSSRERHALRDLVEALQEENQGLTGKVQTLEEQVMLLQHGQTDDRADERGRRRSDRQG